MLAVAGETAMERESVLLSVQTAMARLPEEQRLAVSLVLVEGLPYKEAAAVLEIPIGTLTSRLARGREALQKMLAPAMEDPEDPRDTEKALSIAATVDKNVMYSAYLDFAHDNGLPPTSKSWFYRDLDTATASKVKEQRVRKGGVDVHNILGARISNPPPRRPTKNEPIVIYATAPAGAMNTAAADVGVPEESGVALDEMVANLRTSKRA